MRNRVTDDEGTNDPLGPGLRTLAGAADIALTVYLASKLCKALFAANDKDDPQSIENQRKRGYV
jgi:hypothetical protein